MSLRDIVVVLDAGTASEERLRLATSIARQHEACLRLEAVAAAAGEAGAQDAARRTSRLRSRPPGSLCTPSSAWVRHQQPRSRSRQQQGPFDGSLQSARRRNIHSEMGDYHPVQGYCLARGRHVSHCFVRDPDYVVDVSERRDVVEIEERR